MFQFYHATSENTSGGKKFGRDGNYSWATCIWSILKGKDHKSIEMVYGHWLP
jgi:hypothetical protein